MIGLNAISSVSSGATFSSQDSVQRIARLPALAKESGQGSSGRADDDDSAQFHAQMLQAEIESLQQQLDGLQNRRDSSANYARNEAQSERETPPADGINRPTANHKINVYI